MQRALEIPEIAHDISQFLRAQDRTACILVCKQWHHAFLPLVWEKILTPTICESLVTDHHRRQTVKKHAHLIREYRLPSIIDDQDPVLWMHHLVSIHISSDRVVKIAWGAHDERLAQVIRQNRSLARIKSDYSPLMIFSSVLQAMIDSPSLQSLTMECTHEFPPQKALGSLVWKVCSRLKTLTFNMRVPPSEIPTLDRENSRLQDLTMRRLHDQDPRVQLRLLEQYPSLRRLSWPLLGCQDTLLQEFMDLFVSDTWPDLEYLEIDGARLSRETLSKVLETVECAASLGLVRSDFRLTTLDVLLQSQALKMVRNMELKGCTAVTSPMVQEILSSCPSLQIFSADELSSVDILEVVNDTSGYPTIRSKNSWVCLGLDNLSIRITIRHPSGTKGMLNYRNELVMEQLSKLRHITRLDLINQGGCTQLPLEDDEDVEGLKFKCGQGLECLRTWTRFQSLCFSDRQELTVKELRWILGNWPAIRTIYGPCNDDPCWIEWASKWFKEVNIELSPPCH